LKNGGSSRAKSERVVIWVKIVYRSSSFGIPIREGGTFVFWANVVYLTRVHGRPLALPVGLQYLEPVESFFSSMTPRSPIFELIRLEVHSIP
jgi:hypothetical protein